MFLILIPFSLSNHCHIPDLSSQFHHYIPEHQRWLAGNNQFSIQVDQTRSGSPSYSYCHLCQQWLGFTKLLWGIFTQEVLTDLGSSVDWRRRNLLMWRTWNDVAVPVVKYVSPSRRRGTWWASALCVRPSLTLSLGNHIPSGRRWLRVWHISVWNADVKWIFERRQPG